MGHHGRRECDHAMLWNGSSIKNLPNRTGFVDTLVEVWGTHAYSAPGFYEPQNGHVIVDLGANLGLFTRWVLHVAPRANVMAFEPFPENVAMLRQNVAAFPDRVSVYPVAVAAVAGECRMSDGGARSIDHVLGGDSPSGPVVNVITLEEVIALASSEFIDLVKIDIEGSERDIFENPIRQELMRRVRHFAIEIPPQYPPRHLESHSASPCSDSSRGRNRGIK